MVSISGERLEREVVRLKAQFTEAIYLGLADGAASNWVFLEQHTQHQLIDFFDAGLIDKSGLNARAPQFCWGVRSEAPGNAGMRP